MKSINLGNIRNYFLAREGKAIGYKREFAVLTPFVEKDGEVFLLMEQRASDMEDAPGEICFPGGQIETGETPVEAAIRETSEELGISAENIEIIGEADRLYTLKGAVIYAVPGGLDAKCLDSIKPNPSEVEEFFLAPLNHFIENEPYVHMGRLIPDRSDFPYEMAGIDESYPWDAGRSEVPVYKALSDGKIVWGLTANIIRHFIEDFTSNAE